jgi:hypothetical protein
MLLVAAMAAASVANYLCYGPSNQDQSTGEKLSEEHGSCSNPFLQSIFGSYSTSSPTYRLAFADPQKFQVTTDKRSCLHPQILRSQDVTVGTSRGHNSRSVLFKTSFLLDRSLQMIRFERLAELRTVQSVIKKQSRRRIQ